MFRTFPRLVLASCLSLMTGMAFGQTPFQMPVNEAETQIDFEWAKGLLQKLSRGEKLTADEDAYLQRAKAVRGRQPQGPVPPAREQTGLKPLTEMTAEDLYQGEDGGLYGGGRNSPDEQMAKAARKQVAKIVPFDRAGEPALNGKVVLVSISMSNATQEFSTFKRLADSQTDLSPWLRIVDCAQGGQAMAEWADPQAGPWRIAEERIHAANLTTTQVQVAWIKLANKGPRGTLQEHGQKLKNDTLAVIQSAKAHFPNLRIAYLGSRIYGGYAQSNLNPEPYAYESAFPARWLIMEQAKGDAALNYDPERGPVKAPLLLWGPYLWGDGTSPRASDKLTWLREDFTGDGIHPSQLGRDKVANLLLDFFRHDETSKPWFNR